MNTLESSGGQFFLLKTLKVHFFRFQPFHPISVRRHRRSLFFHSSCLEQIMLEDFQTSVKCEEADINHELVCRAEKISRIEADLLRVEQELARAEAARLEVMLRLRLR